MEVKTTDPRRQDEVNIVNAIMQRIMRYIHRRHENEPYPDFSNAMLQLGCEERNALAYCSQAVPIVGGPGTPFTQLHGIRVVWVRDSTHCLIVEDAERRERPTYPPLCSCQYKIGDTSAKVQEGQ